MTPQTGLMALITFIFWGSSTFFDKLATNVIGSKGAIIWALSSLPTLVILTTTYLFADRLGIPKPGVGFLVLAQMTSNIASISYYLLMSKAQASLVIPLTSLYPVVGVILAFIILKEAITVTKIAGILFSMIAIFLLSL